MENPYAAPTSELRESPERQTEPSLLEAVVNVLFVIAVVVLAVIFCWITVALVLALLNSAPWDG
jgi:hypothetical protein